MMKRLPFNIYSIDNIDEWRKDYFYPVSLAVGETIDADIASLLIKEYDNVGNELKMHYRIATKQLYIELYDLLMKLILADRMKGCREYEFVLTNHRCPEDVSLPKRCYAFDLYKGRQDILFSTIDLTYHATYYQSLSRYKKARQLMVDILKLRPVLMRDRKRAFLMVPNRSTRDYVRAKYDSSPCYVRPEMIFHMNARGNGGALQQEFEEIAINFSGHAEGLFQKITGHTFPEKILENLKKAVYGHFSRIDADIGQARLFFAKLPDRLQLYTGTAKYYTRVVSEVVRERGGRVTGFPHGGGLSGLVNPRLSFTELATCDSFACFDEEDANCFKQYATFNKVTFPIAPEMGKSPLKMDAGGYTKPAGIDPGTLTTIMYLNYSYWYDQYSYGVRDYIQGLDLQLRVIDFLLGLQKKIIFKLRPKTALLGKHFNHFGYYGDRVSYMDTPFTQVLDKGDLFVFEGLSSTALYEAMTLTDKPILLFKPPFPKCTPDFEKLLHRRCYVIDLYEDDRNRLCFDEAVLKKIFRP